MWPSSDTFASQGLQSPVYSSQSHEQYPAPLYAVTSPSLDSQLPVLSAAQGPLVGALSRLGNSSSSSSLGHRSSIAPSSASSAEANSPNSPAALSTVATAPTSSFAAARKGTRFERDPALSLETLLNMSQMQDTRRPSESMSVALLSPMHSGFYMLPGQNSLNGMALSDDRSNQYDFPFAQSTLSVREVSSPLAMTPQQSAVMMSPPIIGSHLLTEPSPSFSGPAMSYYPSGPSHGSVADDKSQLQFQRAMSAHDLSGLGSDMIGSDAAFYPTAGDTDPRSRRRRAATSLTQPQWMSFEPPSLPSVLRPTPSPPLFSDQALIAAGTSAAVSRVPQQQIGSFSMPLQQTGSSDGKTASTFKSPAKVLAYQARVRLQRGALNDVIADLNWAFREAVYPGSPGRDLREILSREGIPTEPTSPTAPTGSYTFEQQKQLQASSHGTSQGAGPMRPNLVRTTSAPMFSVVDYSPYSKMGDASHLSMSSSRNRSHSGSLNSGGDSLLASTAEKKLALRRSQQNAHKHRIRALEVNNIQKLLGLCEYMVSCLASAGYAPVVLGNFLNSLDTTKVSVHPEFGRVWGDFRRVLIEHQRSWDLFLAAERRLVTGAGSSGGSFSSSGAFGGLLSPKMESGSQMSPTIFSITLMALTQA